MEESKGLPSTCCMCDTNIKNGNSIMLLCSCLIAICNDCGIKQLSKHDNTYYSYIECPICNNQESNSINKIIRGVEEAEYIQQQLFYQSCYHFQRPPLSRNKNKISKIKLLSEYFQLLMCYRNLDYVILGYEDLYISQNEDSLEKLKLLVARLECYRQLQLPNKPKYESDLPLGPLSKIWFATNHLLESILLERREDNLSKDDMIGRIETYCGLCGSDASLVHRSVLSLCTCKSQSCQNCQRNSLSNMAEVSKDLNVPIYSDCSFCKQSTVCLYDASSFFLYREQLIDQLFDNRGEKKRWTKKEKDDPERLYAFYCKLFKDLNREGLLKSFDDFMPKGYTTSLETKDMCLLELSRMELEKSRRDNFHVPLSEKTIDLPLGPLNRFEIKQNVFLEAYSQLLSVGSTTTKEDRGEEEMHSRYYFPDPNSQLEESSMTVVDSAFRKQGGKLSKEQLEELIAINEINDDDAITVKHIVRRIPTPCQYCSCNPYCIFYLMCHIQNNHSGITGVQEVIANLNALYLSEASQNYIDLTMSIDLDQNDKMIEVNCNDNEANGDIEEIIIVEKAASIVHQSIIITAENSDNVPAKSIIGELQRDTSNNIVTNIFEKLSGISRNHHAVTSIETSDADSDNNNNNHHENNDEINLNSTVGNPIRSSASNNSFSLSQVSGDDKMVMKCSTSSSSSSDPYNYTTTTDINNNNCTSSSTFNSSSSMIPNIALPNIAGRIKKKQIIIESEDLIVQENTPHIGNNSSLMNNKSNMNTVKLQSKLSNLSTGSTSFPPRNNPEVSDLMAKKPKIFPIPIESRSSVISSNNYQSQESIPNRINANEMIRPTIATAIVPSTMHTIAESKPSDTSTITNKSNKIRAKDFFLNDKSNIDNTSSSSSLLLNTKDVTTSSSTSVLNTKDDMPNRNQVSIINLNQPFQLQKKLSKVEIANMKSLYNNNFDLMIPDELQCFFSPQELQLRNKDLLPEDLIAYEPHFHHHPSMLYDDATITTADPTITKIADLNIIIPPTLPSTLPLPIVDHYDLIAIQEAELKELEGKRVEKQTGMEYGIIFEINTKSTQLQKQLTGLSMNEQNKNKEALNLVIKFPRGTLRYELEDLAYFNSNPAINIDTTCEVENEVVFEEYKEKVITLKSYNNKLPSLLTCLYLSTHRFIGTINTNAWRSTNNIHLNRNKTFDSYGIANNSTIWLVRLHDLQKFFDKTPSFTKINRHNNLNTSNSAVNDNLYRNILLNEEPGDNQPTMIKQEEANTITIKQEEANNSMVTLKQEHSSSSIIKQEGHSIPVIKQEETEPNNLYSSSMKPWERDNYKKRKKSKTRLPYTSSSSSISIIPPTQSQFNHHNKYNSNVIMSSSSNHLNINHRENIALPRGGRFNIDNSAITGLDDDDDYDRVGIQMNKKKTQSYYGYYTNSSPHPTNATTASNSIITQKDDNSNKSVPSRGNEITGMESLVTKSSLTPIDYECNMSFASQQTSTLPPVPVSMISIPTITSSVPSSGRFGNTLTMSALCDSDDDSDDEEQPKKVKKIANNMTKRINILSAHSLQKINSMNNHNRKEDIDSKHSNNNSSNQSYDSRRNVMGHNDSRASSDKCNQKHPESSNTNRNNNSNKYNNNNSNTYNNNNHHQFERNRSTSSASQSNYYPSHQSNSTTRDTTNSDPYSYNIPRDMSNMPHDTYNKSTYHNNNTSLQWQLDRNPRR